MSKKAVMEIRPDAICFHHGLMEIEGGRFSLPPAFWLKLTEAAPPILFKRSSPKNPKSDYVAIDTHSVRPEDPTLHLLPQVSLQGVWWTRRAALEAHESLCLSLIHI